MKYLPHLIPEHARVLPGYFKAMPGTTPPALGHTARILLWVLGIFFALLAIASLIHPLLALLWAMCAVIALPPGHLFLERKLRFRLTTGIKSVSLLSLLVTAFTLAMFYATADEREIQRQQAIEEQQRAAQAIIDKKKQAEQAILDKLEQQRSDSIALLLHQARQSIEARRWSEASARLLLATQHARKDAERHDINLLQAALQTARSQELVRSGKYQAALVLIDSLFVQGVYDTELRYNHALCYSKTGKIGEAVSELRGLMEAGNKNAERLHEKINPIRKRIVGYETLCCDGSTSDARGRGACSHHGGVCDWNHPIYEEYRKYE